MMGDRYEEALPHLQAISERWSRNTLHTPEALFLQGVAEIRVLKRPEAAKSLSQFLKGYPEASERMRIAAWRMVDLLEQTEDGSLRDVQMLMEYSRRRLSLDGQAARFLKAHFNGWPGTSVGTSSSRRPSERICLSR